jgi:ketosteroid isomerase-like protein
MFERYTEKARRVIFFARYEASEFGSPYIETEHLLLGLFHEDRRLSMRFLPAGAMESIREQVDQHTFKRAQIPTHVDLPLSNEGKRVLVHAAEEADQLGSKYISTEHLLLGLLREENSFAQSLLHERGLRLRIVRESISGQGRLQAQEAESIRLLDSERMLVQAVNERDAEELESYYCEDATVILSHQPARTGKQEIREWIDGLVANRSVKLIHKNSRAELSADGSLAYTTCEYQMEIIRQDDSVHHAAGRLVQIWRREGRDLWKIAVEIGSASGP